MAANDSFGGRGGSIDSPASGGEVVTPDDSTEFVTVSRGIYVGGAGDVAAVMVDGTVLTFVGVQAGSLLPIRCKRVNSTNTTATDMLALY
jgi:hypothetical protein